MWAEDAKPFICRFLFWPSFLRRWSKDMFTDPGHACRFILFFIMATSSQIESHPLYEKLLNCTCGKRPILASSSKKRLKILIDAVKWYGEYE